MFIESFRNSVDIFCFQEVLHQESVPPYPGWDACMPDLFSKISDILGFEGIITEPYSPIGERLAIFTSKNIEVEDHGVYQLSKGDITPIDGAPFHMDSMLQWVSFVSEGSEFTAANVHGLWVKGDKSDTPKRIDQSNQILQFFQKRTGAKILSGDLNISLNTQSIKMIDGSFENLVRLNNIQSTRSAIYTGEDKYADYIFTSKDVYVNSFSVLRVDVSDHLPLCLDFKPNSPLNASPGFI